jgi:hypothetical protein
MQQTTTVTLGNDTDTTTPSSFEEAFGEYSEVRGKGRNRRQARRLDRKKKRQERRMTRISNRGERKRARQAIRGEQQEARQSRKDIRTSRRMARKDMRQGPEVEMDEQMMMETDNGYTYDQGAPQDTQNGYAPEDTGNGYAPEDSGYEPQGGGYEPQGGGYEPQGGGYEPQGGGYEPQGGGYEPQGGGGEYMPEEEEWGGTPPYNQEEEGGYGDEEPVDSPSGAYQEDNDDEYGAGEGTGDGGWGFDGIMGAEDRFSEMQDAKTIKISPKVAELTRKIEWNKELITRLRVKKAQIEGSNGNPNDVNKQIAIRKQRILDLQTQLQQYADFQGEYSCADGEEATRPMRMKRRREIQAGRNMAISQRRNMRKVKDKNTPVARGLNPEFEPQRIVIPARTSSVTGQTGLNGLDLMDDYDAPDVRTVELSSSAEGDKKKKINWVGIGIGAAVAVGAIWALRKYKVI